MAFPKIPQLAQLGNLPQMLQQLQSIDVNAITEKIDQFLATAQKIYDRCERIEKKLDAVIDAAEIKVNDGHAASCDCRSSAITINNGKDC